MERTLRLLNIPKYIEKNSLKEVKNANIFGIGKNSFDENGLWSEIIFGRIGSKDRKTRFGYIDLGTTLVNPIIYKMMKNASEEIRDILAEKRFFNLTPSGKLKEDDMGHTGLLFLTSIKDKINFEESCKKDKKDVGVFLNKNRDLIFIDKYIIMPAGIRDMSSSKKNVKQFTSEINDLYERLISLNSQLKIQLEDPEMTQIFAIQIQKCLNLIYYWIQNKLEGKQGILRGTMLKKTVDYSARIVATSDPNIPLGFIGLPWHTILTLYEPFFFHYVLKQNETLRNLIKAYLKISNRELSFVDLKGFNLAASKNPDVFDGALKDELMKCANEIVKDKDILVKRDPVTSRSSYCSQSIIALSSGRGAVVNSYICGPLTLDFDGDTLALIPTFTKEALSEAKKINPAKSKTVWADLSSKDNQVYSLTLDAMSTIYVMTKE